MKGKLTIDAVEGSYIYEATGVQNADNNDYGDAVYDAEASAMRRACAKAGLGLDLWLKEKQSNSLEENSTSHQFSKPIVNNHQQIKDRKIVQSQINELIKLSRECNLSTEQSKAILQNLGYKKSADIPMAKFDEVCQAFRDAKVEVNVWETWQDQDDAIAYCCNEIPDIHMNAVTKEWNKLLEFRIS